MGWGVGVMLGPHHLYIYWKGRAQKVINPLHQYSYVTQFSIWNFKLFSNCNSFHIFQRDQKIFHGINFWNQYYLLPLFSFFALINDMNYLLKKSEFYFSKKEIINVSLLKKKIIQKPKGKQNSKWRAETPPVTYVHCLITCFQDLEIDLDKNY